MARLTLLGVEVDTLTIQDLNDRIAEAIREGGQIVIANHNLHSIYLYHKYPLMKSFYKEAHFVHMDGMPLVFWARIKGHPLRRWHRVSYLDWGPSLFAEAQARGWRLFYLGGRPGVAERAAEKLRAYYPSLQIATHHGYFDMYSEENRQIIDQINAFSPHILFVGMGMPRQEEWVLQNKRFLQVNVLLTSGAFFDYIAGAIPTPPRWMGQVGLEWLYRLLAEPRRLWKRYLVEPFYLLPLLIRDLLGKNDTGKGC